MAEAEAPNVHPTEPEWMNLVAVRDSIDIIRDGASDSTPDEETISVLRMMALRKREVAPQNRRFVDKVTVMKVGDGVVVTATSMSRHAVIDCYVKPSTVDISQPFPRA